MSTQPTSVSHPIRGTLLAIVFAPLLIYFGLNAVSAMAATFIGGWLPSQWFSDNPADWLFAVGQAGGAANYLTFMVSAMLAYGCWWVLRWGFTGKTND
jgi:hypothetical protein